MENTELKTVGQDLPEMIETDLTERKRDFSSKDVAAVAVGSAGIGAAIVLLVQKVRKTLKARKTKKTEENSEVSTNEEA